jgi:chromosome segregation ATPase
MTERRTKLEAEIATLKNELRASQATRTLLAADVSRIATEKISAILEKEAEIKGLRVQLDRCTERFQSVETVLRSVERSLSWRTTKPLRDFMQFARRLRSRTPGGKALDR